MNHGLIPYIGGKHRLADTIVSHCKVDGVDCLVDVFGGSAAITLAAAEKFAKLIYNDIDGDLVNLFRVISDPTNRIRLFKLLRWLPPSRQIYNEDGAAYLAGGFSFCRVADPVERARKTFYRHAFAFGGKTRTGGFAVSIGDRERIKEVFRYRNMLRKLVRVGTMFRATLIENQHYSEIISKYGGKPNVCLFIDPPYIATETYYARTFGAGDHAFLAEQLNAVKARVVCTYYDSPALRSLYPSPKWQWYSVCATKNSAMTRGNKVITNEFVIVKP